MIGARITGARNLKGKFLLSFPKNNGILFHHKMLGYLKRLGFELIQRLYEIESMNGEIDQDEDLAFIEIVSRNSFVKRLIKKEKYQRGNNYVVISSHYPSFEDLMTGLSTSVTISSNSGLEFVLH
jgi:hypothetical protein